MPFEYERNCPWCLQAVLIFHSHLECGINIMHCIHCGKKFKVKLDKPKGRPVLKKYSNSKVFNED